MVTNSLFVTGTGTSVGKTYVCARLLAYLTIKGIRAGYQKWVATGVDADLPEDLAFCLDAALIPPAPELVDQLVPYRFRFPAAPHLAAELEEKSIDPAVIIEKYVAAAEKCEWLIVEGVGGILVPLRRDLLLADLLARLRPKTLVVARSGLGTINHTLLTIEALRRRRIPVLGIIFSDPEEEENERLVQDNMRVIQETGRIRVFGRLPWQQNAEKADRAFAAVGQAILGQMLREQP